MNSRIPCFTDSDDNRFPSEEADESPLSLTEQRLEWLCDDWKDALSEGTFDAWHSVRMMIYGAIQMTQHMPGWYQDRNDLQTLSKIAFENSLEQIAAGNYLEAV